MKKTSRKTLSRSFFRWLLLIVAAVFLISLIVSWMLETGQARDTAFRLLRLNIQDVRQDIMDASDKNLLVLTRQIAAELENTSAENGQELEKLLKKYNVTEINVIDRKGIITATTNDEFLHYDMHAGEQSAAFTVLLDGSTDEYVQSYGPTAYDPVIYRKYAAVCLDTGGFVQVGYGADQFQKDIDAQVVGAARNRHVGETGYLIIAAEDGKIVSDRNDYKAESLEAAGIRIDRATMPEEEVFRADVFGVPCSCMYAFSEGYDIVAVCPEAEILRERNLSAALDAAGDVLIFAVLFLLVFLLVRTLVVRNIDRIIGSLTKITGGDLEESVEVRSHAEFSVLSDEINATVHSLKQYTEAEKARMEADLALAQKIQQSAVPSVFPPYPNRKDFSLFAGMKTAREVGGDFYDFYLPEEKTLVFLIADVSGKGIPAAMFMMSCKAVLRDYTERGDPPAEVLENANRTICADNEAEMFVTAWMGFLETDTGRVRFINAGHIPPVLIRGGQAGFVPMKANLILGFLENTDYREQTLLLQPGDFLFLYTDGITEAMDPEGKQYGKERLLQVLSADFGTGGEACEKICGAVERDVEAFAAGTLQFDDMTMLCLYYQGNG